MKKNSIVFIIMFILSLGGTLTAFANTIAILSPETVIRGIDVEFDVTITIDTKDVENFTEKVEINFPSDLLEIQSFTFADTWMALPSDEYSLIDNENGTLIKTGGYPGGVTGSVEFGTITFKTLKEGNGFIELGNGGLAFEIDEQTEITGDGITFFVTAPVEVVAPTEEIVNNPVAVTNTSYTDSVTSREDIVTEGIIEVVEEGIEEVVDEKNKVKKEKSESGEVVINEISKVQEEGILEEPELASTAGFKSFGTGILLGILGTLLLIGMSVYFVFRFRSKS